MKRDKLLPEISDADINSTIECLLRIGSIFVDGHTYAGVASDGQEVQFGQIGDERHVFSYLLKNPSPQDW